MDKDLPPSNPVLDAARAQAQLMTRSGQLKPKTVDEATEPFDGLLVNMLLQQARDARIDNELFDNENVELYQSMLDQRIADEVAKRSGFGVSDALRRQLGVARDDAGDGQEKG